MHACLWWDTILNAMIVLAMQREQQYACSTLNSQYRLVEYCTKRSKPEYWNSPAQIYFFTFQTAKELSKLHRSGHSVENIMVKNDKY